MKKEYVSIGLTNPKGVENVGSVMRAAGCYQVDQVLYSGQRYDRAAKMTTDTKNASSTIPLINIETLNAETLIDAVEHDTQIICVDLIQGATPLPSFQHPEKALYIFEVRRRHDLPKDCRSSRSCGVCSNGWLYEFGRFGECAAV
ncbi:TrmH family RNA methyltransferase [Marinomonas sp. GJ51-6]|uniref:TrmH family RNA methyltransferase n=1 Tax=Marinomonas sp. GJ51-6 TaxID=2992802 RepID=UPI0029343B3B|nr:TrmH family RNA methyltransferase [Marinomonas sp. GJ51-6]WOD08011.1 TrmH family RNA methyltransferase [Marinomonas sp. GJ51-6]